ncbi:MAG: hypothetical protein A2Z75_07645 [Chloroflexi bacterium RBG_13_50_10]|nr:MAG: hypothetical protein A2Z75_07645 [Chloroflexi bacterium RBG_13_50_10]
MYRPLFDEFLTSGNTLRVYKGNKLLFTSDKDRLLPLVEYIEKFASRHRNVVIFDKIMGRAAALLCVKAHCGEVYSPLGSQLAVEVLGKRGIKYHLTRTVPCIQTPNENMCPMELLSVGKEPEEFYRLIKNLLAENHC